MNDDLFNYLVATDTLDEFLGYKEQDDDTNDDDLKDLDDEKE